MGHEDIIIIGGGPCGIAASLALQKKGFQPLIIEKGNIVNSIYHYPTHQTFFSSSEKLEIGGVPFITENRKPKRNQALAYYRSVVEREQPRIHRFETVTKIEKEQHGETFHITTTKDTYKAKYVVVATGYYDHPNVMGVLGEDLPHIHHYFHEAHPYFQQRAVVIGGKNSSVDAALELVFAGAYVTVLYRGDTYSSSVKPWILPEFEALVRNGTIQMEFRANVKAFTPESVFFEKDGEEKSVPADVVFAMTGYRPDHAFLRRIGVKSDEETGRPTFSEETMETNVRNCFIAGVIAAGNNANEIFIENGRFHGGQIAECIATREGVQKQ
ncbi:YpdA family putative bacillithiol disulfide reductase [Bacillus fonticola]|uniref:YpdA family putative bacillithiol disulfide reductase n=1 Tax=Bacillus fonticola TaxID=2728853 RepID=UPI0014751878|nr:YpdA family putative bacillithiol disulfide reductase [Bacillus fonticola]